MEEFGTVDGIYQHDKGEKIIGHRFYAEQNAEYSSLMLQIENDAPITLIRYKRSLLSCFESVAVFEVTCTDDTKGQDYVAVQNIINGLGTGPLARENLPETTDTK